MKVAAFCDNFKEIYTKEPRKVIVWGAGYGLQQRWSELSHIDVICDCKADEIGVFKGMRVAPIADIVNIKEDVYIIVSAKSQEVFDEICDVIANYGMNAIVFHLYNNIAWGYSYSNTAISCLKKESCKKLRVNIVNKEESWILKKFADRMEQLLKNMGVEVFVSADTRDDVDINHHIPYVSYRPYKNDTLMITHVDNLKKLEILKKQLEIAGMGICMSKDTMDKLVSYGVPRNKVCYINPAQDNMMSIRKYTIGITHRCYDEFDVRKRATSLLDVLEGVNSQYFKFVIMGAGWDDIIEKMRHNGFEVEYYCDFDYKTYVELMQNMDYFLYMGFDEGTMGYLDALAAGVGTIVTPQGYHLDVDYPIDYPCNTVKQFRDAFLDLQRIKERKIAAVSQLTWENYVLKHLEIWDYLLKRKSMKDLFAKQLCYEDGIYSVYPEDNRI